jgi:hypothetical protein
MSIQEVSAEQLAKLFHHYHQALAPNFGSGDKQTPAEWNEVPQQEKSRMVVAARLALLEIDAAAGERSTARKYFAKPGEAEWGC